MLCRCQGPGTGDLEPGKRASDPDSGPRKPTQVWVLSSTTALTRTPRVCSCACACVRTCVCTHACVHLCVYARVCTCLQRQSFGLGDDVSHTKCLMTNDPQERTTLASEPPSRRESSQVHFHLDGKLTSGEDRVGCAGSGRHGLFLESMWRPTATFRPHPGRPRTCP